MATKQLHPGALRLVTIQFLIRGSPIAKPAVWFFNIFGTIDLLLATTLATVHNATVSMGPSYWIPAFWVPLLLVTPYVTFLILRRNWNF